MRHRYLNQFGKAPGKRPDELSKPHVMKRCQAFRAELPRKAPRRQAHDLRRDSA